MPVENRASLEVDCLVHAKDPQSKCLGSVLIEPGPACRTDGVFKHQELLIYVVAEFAGDAEEVGRHVSGCELLMLRGSVNASSDMSLRSCLKSMLVLVGLKYWCPRQQAGFIRHKCGYRLALTMRVLIHAI